MELRSFDVRKLPLPPWLTFSLIVGLGAGSFVFLVSLASPASFFYSLSRGLIAFLIFFGESVFLIYLFSKYDVDSLLFGRKIKVDLRSLASLKDFAWVYRLKKEDKLEGEEPSGEEEPPLEKLLSKPSEFEEKVEELTEVVRKKPESAAKVIRLMMEED